MNIKKMIDPKIKYTKYFKNWYDFLNIDISKFF